MSKNQSCPHCPFIAGGAQGLAAHIKAKHPEKFIKKGNYVSKKKKRKYTKHINATAVFDRSLSTPTNVGIKFCPNCGINVEKVQRAMNEILGNEILTAQVIERVKMLGGGN